MTGEKTRKKRISTETIFHTDHADLSPQKKMKFEIDQRRYASLLDDYTQIKQENELLLEENHPSKKRFIKDRITKTMMLKSCTATRKPAN